MIEIEAGEIHLWLAFLDRTGERLCGAYRELLSAAELDTMSKFRYAKDQRRYLVTRGLVRTVLSRYIDIEPREWAFSTNAFGRPDIANAKALRYRLVFNISHAHNVVLLGIARSRALGVDVEYICAQPVSIDIADQFFSPDEVAALRAIPFARQQHRFFEYWTFKEAYIKARGMGLSLPLDMFSFHYPDDTSVVINIDPALADGAERWKFWQFMPDPEYLVAVCAERIDAPSSVVIRTDDSIINQHFLRTSSGVVSALPDVRP